MTVHLDSEVEPDNYSPSSDGPTGSMTGGGRRLLWAILALLAVVAAVLAVAVVRDDGTKPAATTPTTAPSTSGSTVTSPTITVPVDTSTAVWPQSTSTTRYSDPVAAARGFAVDFLGFRDPVVGSFMAGDARSGEVEIRAKNTGPATTVFVRQLGADNSWWVLGATTDNIRLTSPAALEVVTSPVHLTGTSTAFEANVAVLIYADGQQAPLASNFVMGGSNGVFGPFDALIDFTTPRVSAGSIVMFTRSMEDGRMWEASVERLRFGVTAPSGAVPEAVAMVDAAPGGGSGEVTLNWDAVSTATGYRVLRSDAEGGVFKVVADLNVITGNTTFAAEVTNIWSEQHTYVPAGAALDTADGSPRFQYVEVGGSDRRCFQVIAYNAAGDGPASFVTCVSAR